MGGCCTNEVDVVDQNHSFTSSKKEGTPIITFLTWLNQDLLCSIAEQLENDNIPDPDVATRLPKMLTPSERCVEKVLNLNY